MQVTLESMTSACAMVKEPNRVNLEFKLKNPSPGTAVRLPPESSRRRASDNVIDIKRRQKPDTNYTTRQTPTRRRSKCLREDGQSPRRLSLA
jgi:hypothetical protein